jgi:hypothetical protein
LDATEAADGAGDPREPAMVDADFEKLATELGAEQEVTPVF